MHHPPSQVANLVVQFIPFMTEAEGFDDDMDGDEDEDDDDDGHDYDSEDAEQDGGDFSEDFIDDQVRVAGHTDLICQVFLMIQTRDPSSIDT